MVEVVKESSDVQVNDPVIAPAAFARCRHCIMRRLSRPISIRVGVKIRLHQRLQVLLDNRLRDPIRYGRYAQMSRASILLRYIYRPDRRREVGPRRHAIPNLVEVILQIFLELLNRLRIHSRLSMIRLNPFIRFPHHLLGNTKRFCLSRWLLPLRRLTFTTSWMTRPLCSIGFPRLLSSYGPLRPCASHRYSHPWRSTPWISPLTSRPQVPTFRTKAWSRVTPPLWRVSSKQVAGSPCTSPGLTTRPGFDTVPTLSTRLRWFIRFVSTGPHLMRSRRTFSRDAHHPDSLPEQLTVVWSLPLPVGSEGPSLIPYMQQGCF